MDHEEFDDSIRKLGLVSSQINPLLPGDPFQFSHDLSKASQNLTGDVKKIFDMYSKNCSLEVSHIIKDQHRNAIYRLFEKEYHTSSENFDLVYSTLIKVNVFNQRLGEVYPQKIHKAWRHTCEGVELAIASIPALMNLLMKVGFEECVLSMSHRGRIETLCCVFDMPLSTLFSKFDGASLVPQGSCDVHHHLGWKTMFEFKEGSIASQLLPNPSHLESVCPVSQGFTKGRIEYSQKRIINVQLHGDGSFFGQGVVQESLGMALVPGFEIGGTIHMIINNQSASHTTMKKILQNRQSSDIAKMTNNPIIHVNAFCIESILKALSFAVEYVNQFKLDVFINILGFREYGHNALTDQRMVQPEFSTKIEKQNLIKKLEAFATANSWETDVLRTNAEHWFDIQIQRLPSQLVEANLIHPSFFYSNFSKTDFFPTGIDIFSIKNLLELSVSVPNHFTVHAYIKREFIAKRLYNFHVNNKLDWSAAEAIAIGSLIKDGFHIRMTGQDVEVGTLHHRHFVIYNQRDFNSYTPLATLSPGSFDIFNSHLSELAVLGFEYGYSVGNINSLTFWEAQNGDFVNNAQTMIDNYIVSGRTKWNLQSKLIMILPHGYDGLGPEHSSCRIERFLLLSNDDEFCTYDQSVNVFIINPASPSQYFHFLRWYSKQSEMIPLVVISPKKLLFSTEFQCPINDFVSGSRFKPLIFERNIEHLTQIQFMILCSGQIYYDLQKIVTENFPSASNQILIVNIQILSPFPHQESANLFEKCCSSSTYIMWVQEEHANAGAWSYVQNRLQRSSENVIDSWNKRIEYFGRKSSATTSTGSMYHHKQEIVDVHSRLIKFINLKMELS